MPDEPSVSRSEGAAEPSRWEALAAAGLFGAGMGLFAATVHGTGAVRVVAVMGLALAGVSLARTVARAPSLSELLGLARVPGGMAAAWCAAGLALGGALAAWYRCSLGLPVLPFRLRGFALLAVLIGVTEELLYRGFLQGRLRALGPAGATLVAALLHGVYKGALFAGPPAPYGLADVVLLGGITMAAGALFGVMRERSGAVWPCLLAHGVFDLVAYGDRASAPWWVWH